MESIGRKRWAIAEGYIPPTSTGPHPQMTSHETVCVLNVGPCDARVEITVFYTGRGPVGPYRLVVPAERTMYVRFNDLTDPAPIPTDTDFASLIESDVPIVVQHTRLDSRQAENAFTQYDRVCGERIIRSRAFPGERLADRLVSTNSINRLEPLFRRWGLPQACTLWESDPAARSAGPMDHAAQ